MPNGSVNATRSLKKAPCWSGIKSGHSSKETRLSWYQSIDKKHIWVYVKFEVNTGMTISPSPHRTTTFLVSGVLVLTYPVCLLGYPSLFLKKGSSRTQCWCHAMKPTSVYAIKLSLYWLFFFISYSYT
jgi:hypothetical protein